MKKSLKAIKLMLKNIIKSKLTWFMLIWLICVIVVTFFNLNLININFAMPYALRICLGCLAWAMLFIIFPIMACVNVVSGVIGICYVVYNSYKHCLQQLEKEDENFKNKE